MCYIHFIVIQKQNVKLTRLYSKMCDVNFLVIKNEKLTRRASGPLSFRRQQCDKPGTEILKSDGEKYIQPGTEILKSDGEKYIWPISISIPDKKVEKYIQSISIPDKKRSSKLPTKLSRAIFALLLELVRGKMSEHALLTVPLHLQL